MKNDNLKEYCLSYANKQLEQHGVVLVDQNKLKSLQENEVKLKKILKEAK